MIIISGHLLVPAADRDRFVETMGDLVRRARAADGCLDVAITPDSLDPRRVQNLEVWRDAEALEAWRARADAPDPGVEVEENHVKRYDAEDGGPLFPEAD